MNFKLHTATLMSVVLSVLIFTGCSTDDLGPDTEKATTAQKAEIGFGSYLGRAALSRGTATLEPADVALKGGIGLFAMYKKAKKYVPESTEDTDTACFEANFMDNAYLYSSLTNDSLQKVKANVADNWTYGPVRYWPNGEDEYVSFLAYTPYNAQYKRVMEDDGDIPLLNKAGNYYGRGDCKYLPYYQEKDPRDHQDLMYASGNITNMQLYQKDGKWQKSGDFYQPEGSTSLPKVQLNLRHATARVGFTVTSSALKDPRNYTYYLESTRKYTLEEIINAGMEVEIEYPISSDVYITVNKVMFLGDNSSAETSSPKGTFYGVGTLNLTASRDTKDPWQVKLKNDYTDLAFTYDNTDTIRTVNGFYEDGDTLGHINLKNGDESAKYIWTTYEVLDSDEYIGEALSSIGSSPMYRSWNKTYDYWVNYIKKIFADDHNSEVYFRWIFSPLGMKSTSEEGIKDFVNTYIYNEWKKAIWGNIIYASWNEGDDGKPAAMPDINSVGSRMDDYMFIIPQDFTSVNSDNNELWVYLDYTVHYNEGVSGEVEKQGINYKVYHKIEKNFEAGKAYIIAMDINGKGNQFNAIEFSVKTDNWSDETPVGVNF